MKDYRDSLTKEEDELMSMSIEDMSSEELVRFNVLMKRLGAEVHIAIE